MPERTSVAMRILALALWGFTPALAQDEHATGASQDSMRELAALVPQGTPIRKVHFPRFDENGKLQAIIDAAVMTKLDAGIFSLQELSIRLYDAEGQLDMRLINPHAFYDLSRGMLFSLDHSKIFRGSQSQPVIEGTGLVFDVERRAGSLLKDTVARFRVEKETISREDGPESAHDDGKSAPAVSAQLPEPE